MSQQARFCIQCGAAVTDIRFCLSCGAELVLERNRQAVAALVCGIVAMLLAIFPGLFFIAWFPGGLALWLGLKARKKPNRRKLASWGLGLGIVSLIFAISYASVRIPTMFGWYDPRS